MPDGAILRLTGKRLDLNVGGQQRQLTDEDTAALTRFGDHYAGLLRRHPQAADYLALGRDLSQWLDGRQGWTATLMAAAPMRITFDVGAQSGAELTENARAFIAAPWELLADQDGHFAAREPLGYCPIRRIGAAAEPAAPSDHRLSLMFMAASPEDGGPLLDFEAEEDAIGTATGNIGLDLTVEESGNLAQLAEAMARAAPVDVLHLSCHGVANPAPCLALEDEVGDPALTTARAIWRELGANTPKLLFLSACHTADMAAPIDPLAVDMCRGGVPAVMGWSGAVGDGEATRFAAEFYKHLARKARVEEAAVLARFALLVPDQPNTPPARDWHLARLFLGPNGGGQLTIGEGARRKRHRDHGYKEFLDAKRGKVPVASRTEFVGRRRQIQTILREFRQPTKAGVLIHAIGRQGKSSLAARIAHRQSDLEPAIVFENYSAPAVLEAIRLANDKASIDGLIQQHKPDVSKNPERLGGVLRELLGNADFMPMLLIIDDLEQALVAPPAASAGGHQLNDETRPVLAAVIEAFRETDTDSRLLLTSRFTFDLMSGAGRDLAADLLDLPLPAMSEAVRRKQVRRKIFGEEVVPDGETAQSVAELMARCVTVSRGNPGLLDTLSGLARTEPVACDHALDEMEAYLAKGDLPDDQRVQEFLIGLTLQQQIDLLTPGERQALSTLTIFELAVPETVAEDLMQTCGLPGLERLIGLGMVELRNDMVDRSVNAVAINGLVRPLADPLNEQDAATLATTVLTDLFACWGGAEGGKRPYPADVELLRLALMAEPSNQAAEVAAATATDALIFLENQFEYPAAAAMAVQAIGLLDDQGLEVSPRLLRTVGDRARAVGEVKLAESCYKRAIARLSDDETHAESDSDLMASLLISQGRLLQGKGKLDEALTAFDKAESEHKKRGADREQAVVKQHIADIRSGRGELDDALLILRSEVQPVYERLGDIRSLSTTMGQIADILQARGDLDEALRILKDELLPVYDRLGDVRSRAVTMGQIADILQARGDLDEALRIHDEQAKVYTKLGDVIGQAHILWSQGNIYLAQDKHQEAFYKISEAYNLAGQVGRLDAIAAIGVPLGQMLIAGGHAKQGCEILTRSRDGFRKLGQDGHADQIDALLTEHCGGASATGAEA